LKKDSTIKYLLDSLKNHEISQDRHKKMKQGFMTQDTKWMRLAPSIVSRENLCNLVLNKSHIFNKFVKYLKKFLARRKNI